MAFTRGVRPPSGVRSFPASAAAAGLRLAVRVVVGQAVGRFGVEAHHQVMEVKGSSAFGAGVLLSVPWGSAVRRDRIPHVREAEVVEVVDISSDELVDAVVAQCQCQPGVE
jgi:hypothetical protein